MNEFESLLSPPYKKPEFKPYPPKLKSHWKRQDIEKSVELIFRDYSYHLESGMGKEKQKEFMNEILKVIDG